MTTTHLDTGDTAWMLIATAMGVILLQWLTIGWSLSFSEGNSFIGGLSQLFLKGITPDTLHGSIPLFLFIAFQGAFACIKPALISGSIAERLAFGPYDSAIAKTWGFRIAKEDEEQGLDLSVHGERAYN
jgi:ammonia channel protein AmtB